MERIKSKIIKNSEKARKNILRLFRSKRTNKPIGGLLMLLGYLIFGLVVFANIGRVWKNLEPAKKQTVPDSIQNALDNFFGSIKVLPQTYMYKEALKEKQPARIIIPKISVDLDVEPARIIGDKWEINQTDASYMLGSSTPEEKGNTVIYGHAKNAIFGGLKKLKAGDIIYVLTNEKWYRYKVTETKEVKPKETQVVGPTLTPTLTLFTCTAFLDSKRLVVVAKIW